MDLGLGFYMKLLILITALFVITTQTSCIEKQNLEESSLGPAADANQVEEAMADGVGSLDFYDVKVNEASSLTYTITYEESQTIKFLNQTLYVDSISDATDKLTINLNFSHEYLQNSNSSFSDVRYPMVIEKNQTLKSLASKDQIVHQLQEQDKPKSPLFLYQFYANLAIFACREDKVTCHNFKFKDFESKLDSQLAHPSICANAQNCIIPIREITFDLIDRKIMEDNGKPKRTFFTLIVSSKLPFFSKVLSYCERGLEEMTGRKVLTEHCLNVNNFSAGAATATQTAN